MASGLTGTSLTAAEIRAITREIESISNDVDGIMTNFRSTMSTLTGQSEGGLIDQTVEAGEQLFNGVMKLSQCFLKLGIHIGDYLRTMITHDSNMASYLREQIMK